MRGWSLRLWAPGCLSVLFLAVGVNGEAASWRADPEVVREHEQRRGQFVYDEAEVPAYTLPDLLVMEDGTRVGDGKTWRRKRRGEILELFRKHVYGRTPIGRPAEMTFTCYDEDPNALDGLATRKQVRIDVSHQGKSASLDLLVYLPHGSDKRARVFVLLNFYGNHTVCADSGIRLNKNWMRSRGQGVVDNRATEASRGGSASRFPIEMILSRGYALATMYYGDIDPDFDDGFTNGVHGVFDEPTEGERAGDAWGSIAAWAWGLSRVMDYFETDGDIDHAHVAVLGHSRLGKTALWAGAQDERFALVISNESGCGGAALSRRQYGETVARINGSFPHWFCDNFERYNDNEGALPVDQHMLIALAAPRPVYVASADRDLWCDPRGEFLACRAAEPVYALFGLPGLGVEAMPGLDTPVEAGHIGYHVRSGSHNLTEFDWRQYLDFADKHLRRH